MSIANIALPVFMKPFGYNCKLHNKLLECKAVRKQKQLAAKTFL